MTEIKPALTAEEWANPEKQFIGFVVARVPNGVVDVQLTEERDRHALAALMLHEQPFGFTWEDVERLRTIAADYEARHDNGGMELYDYEMFTWAQSLADRIAALLPPRTESTT